MKCRLVSFLLNTTVCTVGSSRECIIMSFRIGILFVFACVYCRGSFNNYVDIFLLFFDQLPTSTRTFFTLNVGKKGYFWTTYLPDIVHVVFGRPLVWLKIALQASNGPIVHGEKLSNIMSSSCKINEIISVEIFL